MERVGIRELRQNASRYIDRVKAGETVEVTERGQLVALLVPPTPSRSARDQLVAAGRLIPATGARSLGERRPVPSAGPDTAAVLDDLRRDVE